MRNWTKRTTFLAAFGLALIIMSFNLSAWAADTNVKTGLTPEEVAQVKAFKVINTSSVWEPSSANIVWQMEGWQSGALRPDFFKSISGTVSNCWKWLKPDLYDRHKLGAVSYTTVVNTMYDGGKYTWWAEYPYTGQYDHGAYFEPPSEFLMTEYDSRCVYTEYDDGTMCVNYSRNPEYPDPGWGDNVNLWLGESNRAWWWSKDILGTDKPRECEVFIDVETGRILSERMEFPFQGDATNITCTYEYGDGPFPTGFTLEHTYPARGEYETQFDFTDTTKAKCAVVDGLWFITSYETMRQVGDEEPLHESLVEIKDIKVTPLVDSRNRV